MGILTYELCTGKPAYPGDTLVEVQRAIKNNAIVYPDTISSLCQDFISSILSPDPAKRPSMDSILAHPWLTGNLYRCSFETNKHYGTQEPSYFSFFLGRRWLLCPHLFLRQL